MGREVVTSHGGLAASALAFSSLGNGRGGINYDTNNGVGTYDDCGALHDRDVNAAKTFCAVG